MNNIQTPVKIDNLRVGEKILVTRGSTSQYMGKVIDWKDDKVLVQAMKVGSFVTWHNYKTNFYRVTNIEELNDQLTKATQI